MPTIKISLDQETYSTLSQSAGRDLRPIPWQALVLLRGALGLPFPTPATDEPTAPADTSQ
jgi:hypothetical protein